MSLLSDRNNIIINNNHLALSTIFLMNWYSSTRFSVSCFRLIIVASKCGLLSTHFFFILVTNTFPSLPYDLSSAFLSRLFTEEWSIVWCFLFASLELGSIDLQRKELRIFSLYSLLFLSFYNELISKFFFKALLSLNVCLLLGFSIVGRS